MIRAARTREELCELFGAVRQRAKRYPEYEFTQGFFFENGCRIPVNESTHIDVIIRFAKAEQTIKDILDKAEDISSEDCETIQRLLSELDELCDEFEKANI